MKDKACACPECGRTVTQNQALRASSGPRCKLGDYLLSGFFLLVSTGVAGLCVLSVLEFRGSTDGQAAFGPILTLVLAFVALIIETLLMLPAAYSIGFRIHRTRRDCAFRWGVMIVLMSYIFNYLLLIGGILFVSIELGFLG